MSQNVYGRNAYTTRVMKLTQHSSMHNCCSAVPGPVVPGEVSVQICSGVPSLGEEKQVTEATTKRHNEADLVFPPPSEGTPDLKDKHVPLSGDAVPGEATHAKHVCHYVFQREWVPL